MDFSLGPGCPGAHRLRPRRTGPPFASAGWLVLVRLVLAGCRAAASRRGTRPSRLVGADLQDSLPGVGGEAGGDVPDPERVRAGFPQLVVVAAEEAGPGGEVGGDVRGNDPVGVDLPGLRGEVAQAHGLGGADASGLDGGVFAVHGVDVLGVDVLGMVAARDAAIPPSGMFVQVIEYFQPVFFS